jgi:aminopeptidase 2
MRRLYGCFDQYLSYLGINSLNAFQRKLVGPLAEKLGFEPSESEDTETRELRSTIIASALAAKEPKCVVALLRLARLPTENRILAEAKRRFALYVDQNDESLMHGDLRRAIFIHGVRNGGEKEYEKALSVFRNAPTPQHKIDAMLALTNGGTEALRQRTLDLLSTDEVKTQDVVSQLNATDLACSLPDRCISLLASLDGAKVAA